MKKQQMYVKKSDFFASGFYIFCILLFIGKGVGLESSDVAFQLMAAFSIPFSIWKLVGTRWRRNDILIFIFLSVLGIISWRFSGSMTAFLSALMITAAKDIDIRKIFKIALYIRGFLFILLTEMTIYNFLPENLVYRYRDGDIIVRHSLGYGHPNTAHYTLFAIYSLYMLVHRENVKTWQYLLLFAYTLYIYSYTNSQTGVILTILLLMLCYFSKNEFGKFCLRLISPILNNIYLIAPSLTVIFCLLFYRLPVLRSFGTFSSRFFTATNIMFQAPPSLFGLPEIVTDSGYTAILYRNGIIIFILYIAGSHFLMRQFAKHDSLRYEQFVMFCYAIYTLMESYGLSSMMNVSLLLMVYIIYPNSQ